MPRQNSNSFHHQTARSLLFIAGLSIIAVISPTSSAFQQSSEQVDLRAVQQIREQAFNHSQIMETVEYLTDVVGPRLTGSPALKRAEEYAAERLREWGVRNTHLEAWGPFGRGWTLQNFSAKMIAPSFYPLIAYPKAWSPSTNGPIKGEPVFFDVRTIEDLSEYKGKLRNRIVLFSPLRNVAANFQPPAAPTTDEELRKLADAPSSAPDSFVVPAAQRANNELILAKWRMLFDEGAAAVIEAGRGDAGTVTVTYAFIPYSSQTPPEKRHKPWDLNASPAVPQVVASAEQYNRLVRLVQKGIRIELELNIDAKFHDEDLMSYNLIGEIPGTDLKDEVVMIGGCIDSWHTATGATDNAAGAATAMEVMRILNTVQPRPRRTVRIGLWSAEEQGGFGSRAYVAAHLARRVASNEPPESSKLELKPDYEKFSCYFNLDYGTGKIRGIYLQGNEAARSIFRGWLAPFADLGATTVSLADIGSTDHVSFDEIGLPGFQFIRDFMEGNTRTAHTNMDLYEHVLEEDLKQSAAVAASLVYRAAMRDARFPRKPAR